ncbi:trehalose-phosphatase [Nonomuraea sp. NPDC049695]|uniref:trehalose-phosphatase n=1 Tax=Nonomuraea sp. NPDC049695 TaxID=3154734 RepID=UPI00343BDCBD
MAPVRAGRSVLSSSDETSSARGLDEAISATVSHPAKTGFFFDYDGTLAPIMLDPAAVRPVAGAVERSADLVTLVARVAIISARPVEFLQERFANLPEMPLYGLYGLQSYVDGEVRIDHEAAAWEPVMSDTARAAGRQAGRMVVELKPPVRLDKGIIVARECAELTTAWYFGDDISDAKAFETLTERERLDPAFTGVRVAVANGETGARLAALADLCVDAPEAVPEFLYSLVRALRDQLSP